MARASISTRKHGTGSVAKDGKKWRAIAPIVNGSPRVVLGRFDSKYQAQIALEKHLARAAVATGEQK